jgi:hypothetical protein
MSASKQQKNESAPAHDSAIEYFAPPQEAAALAAEVTVRPKFSWGKAFKHFAVVAMAILGLGLALALMTNVPDSNRYAEQLGVLVGKSFWFVLLVSYLIQTRRRAWAIGVVVVLVGIPLLAGLVLALVHRGGTRGDRSGELHDHR